MREREVKGEVSREKSKKFFYFMVYWCWLVWWFRGVRERGGIAEGERELSQEKYLPYLQLTSSVCYPGSAVVGSS